MVVAKDECDLPDLKRGLSVLSTAAPSSDGSPGGYSCGIAKMRLPGISARSAGDWTAQENMPEVDPQAASPRASPHVHRPFRQKVKSYVVHAFTVKLLASIEAGDLRESENGAQKGGSIDTSGEADACKAWAAFALGSDGGNDLLASYAFEDYFSHLVEKFRAKTADLVAAMILLERAKHAGIWLSSRSAHRLFATVLVVALLTRRKKPESRFAYERATFMKMETIKQLHAELRNAFLETACEVSSAAAMMVVTPADIDEYSRSEACLVDIDHDTSLPVDLFLSFAEAGHDAVAGGRPRRSSSV